MVNVLDRYFVNRVTRKPYGEGKGLWDLRLYGIELQAIDVFDSLVPEHVFKEINRDAYALSKVQVDDGSVIDIGGQVGIVSIYLAKRFPKATIYTFEPSPLNFEHLLLNIERNGVENIRPLNKAVSGSGGEFRMLCNYDINTGGSTGLSGKIAEGQFNHSIESVTLDSILEEVGDCSLLKIDCEGAEHEILGCSKRLSMVKQLVGEFHINSYLQSQGHSVEGLEALVRRHVKGLVKIKRSLMCE